MAFSQSFEPTRKLNDDFNFRQTETWGNDSEGESPEVGQQPGDGSVNDLSLFG